MDSYTSLAKCYDIFMDDTPYDEWLDYVIKVFERYKVPKELVLDLGCGTGTFTRMLSKKGYDMIGVDASCDMLVRAVVSICDSINYLLSDEDVITTFKLVENYLDKDGIFVFDFNTVYKYREVIGDCTIAENRDDFSFIWENFYSDEDRINEYDLTIFSKEGELYSKSMETHYQRGYTLSQMKQFIKEAGLEFLEASDADTKEDVSDTSQRIHIVAKCVKPKKRYKEE